MNCDTIRQQLGPYVDGELPADATRAIEDHVHACTACAEELESLRELVATLSAVESDAVPPRLWASIEQRLEQESKRRRTPLLRIAKPAAIAASLLLLAVLGLLTLGRWGDGASTARASAVDFGVLLDGLSLDADAAFGKFLAMYDAKPAGPLEAKHTAAHLNFDTPSSLPGGFEREAVYLLRFGSSTGVAARYWRGDELLCAIFHAPVREEDFGTHRDHPCVVGEHRGHKVTVGPWKLVHLTDPTTCHCVLSKLDEATELPAVMAAVAPVPREVGPLTPHRHQH